MELEEAGEKAPAFGLPQHNFTSEEVLHQPYCLFAYRIFIVKQLECTPRLVQELHICCSWSCRHTTLQQTVGHVSITMLAADFTGNKQIDRALNPGINLPITNCDPID